MARFIKGHGTENDFVILVDPDADLKLEETHVVALADRRAGIGGDGVIRVARAQALLDAGVLEALPQGVQPDEWFMDYRNADGSLAEMCGNGVRVFAHVLASEELIDTTKECGVGTRAGRKTVQVHAYDDHSADVSVGMGTPELRGLSTASVGDFRLAGLAVDMGNPHLAAVIPELTEEALADLPVDQPVEWDAEFFPHGVNLEVVTPLKDDSVHMRVHERGVGETRSCGTGTVAATVAALADAGRESGTVTVHIPGGTVTVEVRDDSSVLRGPSRIVARGETDLLD
ncbi:diaminopimelate epimerase [Corynebacterium sp. 320]|uniref:diaminopimelate epimerase n=1 Tax=Corynebacterium TaxID=1716 RepID=UPI00125CB00A|nr:MULTISPECIES: diaminopimelate epimerase [Corynebacterium]KAB1503761.1 diaminopimelate epimerase [Corynebacterium sp. 320]KAB1553139.1 diaminopimelate epimerase [Corynebacterium sp. 321]KAB1553643.1 diaminopimelate epimerase [Corynebacterium sp. 319]KAB3527897.1 diaminopimelate epimerase [Corynebacterium sp. 250]KAB3540614.1 diaminopimelate epimerase [Corynebacterium sp. 366]